MIILDSTTKSIEVILGATILTNQLAWTSSYVDITTSSFMPIALSGLTNNTIAVTLVPAPAASTQRQLKSLTIYNQDIEISAVTVRVNDTGAARIICSVNLLPDESLVYIDSKGFYVLQSDGSIKTGHAITSLTVSANSSNSNFYPVMVTGTAGSMPPDVANNFTFNPGTGTLTTGAMVAATFTGNLVGSIPNASGVINIIGDATGTGTINTDTAITLNTVNATVGLFGNSSVIPVITVNDKGLVTSVVSTPIASTMVYPTTGIPNSVGNAWSTSYSVTGTGNVVLDTGASLSATNLSVTNAIVGNIAGSSETVTANAQPAITSLGTLTNLSVSGNVSMPATKGDGILITNTYAWADLLGRISPKTTGSTAPEFKLFNSANRSWAHGAGDQADIVFHVPHDYAPGTDMLLHVHWAHNGSNIQGNLVIDYRMSIADRANPMAFTDSRTATLTLSSLNITNSPTSYHRIDEIPMTVVGGSVSLLDTNNVGVDGLININYQVTEIPAISGSITSVNLPFIFQIDIHYQTTNIGTKQNAPNFYL